MMKRLNGILPGFVRALFVVCLLLTAASPAKAYQTAMPKTAHLIQDGVQPGESTPDPMIQPPVAVNDRGTGFNALKHFSLRTTNVLTNDSDPANKRLFVKSFDASGAKGQVTLLDPYPDSSLDTSFGVGGLVTTSITQNNQIRRLIIQPDNKILAGGSIQYGSGNSSFGLARYNLDGSLDNTFNNNGKVTTQFNSSNHSLQDLLLQPDGKIIAAGTAEPYMAVARYNPDGSLDTSFSGDGMLTVGFGQMEVAAYSVARQADGKILLAGYAGGDFALLRFNTNGSLDTTFSGDGKQTTDFGGNDCGLSVLVQSSGKIVVVGTFTSAGDIYDNYIAMARYNKNGSLDTSFGSSGKVATITGKPIFFPQTIQQPDGKLVAAGTDYDNGIVMLVRYNIDGSPDTTFDGDGLVTTDFGKSATANSIALQPGGKILIAGSYYQSSQFDALLARYNPDGSLDPGFGKDGKVIVDFNGEDDYANAVALQADGKIIAGGIAEVNSTQNTGSFGLARLNEDGAYQTRNTFLYDPNGQFNSLTLGEQAQEPFTYVTSNGVLTDSATVTITVFGETANYLPFAQK